jgi:hypothetical protein
MRKYLRDTNRPVYPPPQDRRRGTGARTTARRAAPPRASPKGLQVYRHAIGPPQPLYDYPIGPLRFTAEVFRLCCWARAHLYLNREYELGEAVDGLQAHAERHGLVAELGQDAVHAIIAAAFSGVTDDEEPLPPLPPPDLPPRARGTPPSTIDAAGYLMRHAPERLQAWLDGRTKTEINEIWTHLQGRR